ncbi:hypothetical protein N1851_003867 [Merluccius polli]|uniref:Uncharacterized protein n=1 Tax=Merluccius polli TaxID=89951 RepID=A0AA47N9F6_MERPO|nr:hypothetical protein N1851_003867 [Merluccius polli]
MFMSIDCNTFYAKMTQAQFMVPASYKEELLPINGSKAGGASIGDKMRTTGLLPPCPEDELDMVLSMWNSHQIRPGSNGRDLYHGKPFLILRQTGYIYARGYLSLEITCDPDLHKLCVLIMEENNMEPCHNALEAARLYRELRPLIRALLLDTD